MKILAAVFGLATVVTLAAGLAPARPIQVVSAGDTVSAHWFGIPVPTWAPGGIEVLCDVR